jgi:hypothetical protein
MHPRSDLIFRLLSDFRSGVLNSYAFHSSTFFSIAHVHCKILVAVILIQVLASDRYSFEPTAAVEEA